MNVSHCIQALGQSTINRSKNGGPLLLRDTCLLAAIRNANNCYCIKRP